MNRTGFGVRAAWMLAPLLAAASPAAAQEPQAQVGIAEAAEAAGPPPLAAMSDEEIAAFFTFASASPALEAEIAPLIELMFEPGAPEPGWQDGGVDILAELDALPGGRAANLLRDMDEEVLSVTDLSGEAKADFTGFTSLRLRAAPPGGTDERALISFEPGVWLDFAYQRKTRSNALCSGGLLGLTLHTRTAPQTWSEEQVATMAALVAMMDRFAAREVCLVYSREGENYTARTFLPDGRPLPNPDTDSTAMAVMPASALSAFLREDAAVAP